MIGDGSRLMNCLTAITSTQKTSSLLSVILKIRDLYGFSHIAFHVVRLGGRSGTNPLLLLTYPTEWTQLYIKNNYFQIDPVVRISKVGFLPVDWSELHYNSAAINTFFRKANSYEVGKHGFTIPVRGPYGERSLFTVTSNCNRTEWLKLKMAALTDMQVISHVLHDRAIILAHLRSSPVIPSLSRREQQCLELTARGLLAKQIVPELNISESAIRLYLQSAKRKLGAATMAQAIAGATTMELIES